MTRPGIIRATALALALPVLAACVQPIGGGATAPAAMRPTARPAPTIQSDQSAGLQRYYARVQADLLARGLLRTDGGGPDTQFSASDLARNFERVAFYDEYVRGAGLKRSRGTTSGLRRWSRPVRIAVDFGPGVSPAQRARDTANVASFAARLQRVTGHPISMATSNPNFLVLFHGADDQALTEARIRSLVPRINPASLQLVRTVPRSIHCLVIAFSGETNQNDYQTAVALVRAEHPDLLRRSCIHEEIAQGLGLANDSPRARPSIFNDDDEFALLTTHDEMLLKMLYDRRLYTGISAEAARPIIQRLAAELVGPYTGTIN